MKRALRRNTFLMVVMCLTASAGSGIRGLVALADTKTNPLDDALAAIGKSLNIFNDLVVAIDNAIHDGKQIMQDVKGQKALDALTDIRKTLTTLEVKKDRVIVAIASYAAAPASNSWDSTVRALREAQATTADVARNLNLLNSAFVSTQAADDLDHIASEKGDLFNSLLRAGKPVTTADFHRIHSIIQKLKDERKRLAVANRELGRYITAKFPWAP
jgi:uncharacterized membrane protein